MKEIEYKGIDEKLYTEKLDNGLEVYMVVNEHVNNTYMTLSVKYGSVDTEYKVKGSKELKRVPNGIAHFLEHINFNENENETAHDYFNRLGSSINAFTTFDFTLYEVFATTDFENNLIHLLDYVQKPYITDKIVEKEKGIICEEIKMGKNNPGHKIYFGALESLFVNDRRKYYITGTEDDVRNTTTEELQDVFDTFYHPHNMILCITGNFNPYETIAIIKENQSSKNFIPYKFPVVKSEEEPENVVNKYKEIEANIEIPKVKICYKMKRERFGKIDDRVLGIYLSIILRNNFGSTSLLKEELMEKELIITLGTSRDINNGIVNIEISLETKYPEEVIPIIMDRMKKLKLSEEDLRRRIRCNIASLINDFDDIEYVNTDIVDQLITYNNVSTNLFDIYNNLNITEAREVIKNINLKNNTTVLLVPFKNEEE